MKSFFERNKPVFMIGLLISLIFIGIIIFYKVKPHKETGMSAVKDETLYKVIDEEQKNYEENINGETQITQEQTTDQKSTSNTLQQEEIDKKYGVKEVSFTDKGFIPRVFTIYLGQKIKWTNNTNNVIYFEQIKKTYDDLYNLVEIKPGESTSHKMTELGIWTYREKNSQQWGSADVRPIPPENQ